MTQDQVFKYFEVRLTSLGIISIGVSFACLLLFFLFVSRGEYLYAVVMAVVMVVTMLGAIKLLQYAKTYREELRRHRK